MVVTGPPASGKTTVAEAIAAALGWPLYTKDTFKELLFETLGTGDLEWSSRLGGAAMPGHLDDERMPDPTAYPPLPLPGEVLEYSVGRNVGGLVAAVRRSLGIA